jgi:hypothetical protein
MKRGDTMLGPTEQIAHHNHYVPEFYLKNWSEDGKTVFVYSLLVPNKSMPFWSKRSIEYTAVWDDFYTRNKAGKQIDDFERWFNREFETPSRIIFNKLLHEQAISDDESKHLTRYIFAQHLRTPARLYQILDICKRIMPKVLENSTQSLSMRKSYIYMQKHYNQIIPTGSELQPIKVTADEAQNQVDIKALVGRGSYLFTLKYLLTETVKKVENHKWYVVRSANGIEFPTSDDPVICMNFYNKEKYDFQGGWGKRNGNIILPISPSALLITQIDSELPASELNNSIVWSSFFRRIIIEHAHRYVYAYTKQKGMLAIHPRIGNKILYEKEKREMSRWYYEQSLHESDYE